MKKKGGTSNRRLEMNGHGQSNTQSMTGVGTQAHNMMINKTLSSPSNALAHGGHQFIGSGSQQLGSFDGGHSNDGSYQQLSHREQ